MPVTHALTMRPIAIFQHDPNQRAGQLQTLLNDWHVSTVHIHPEAGDALPRQARDFSGLVLLGSNRSVTDPLPWIAQEKALLKQALAMDIPVLGHCFGGQLLARALGAEVTRNPVPCIGWETLHVTPLARALFGGAAEASTFNWHYETFALPKGATRALFGTHCRNKGFTLGLHIGLQCHLEVTEDIVQDGCQAGAQELRLPCGQSVQPGARRAHRLTAESALPDTARGRVASHCGDPDHRDGPCLHRRSCPCFIPSVGGRRDRWPWPRW